jgi:hypothetical protein
VWLDPHGFTPSATFRWQWTNLCSPPLDRVAVSVSLMLL